MKERWRLEIPAEPDVSDPECVKLLIKLPSSARIERRFSKSDSLKVTIMICIYAKVCISLMYITCVANLRSGLGVVFYLERKQLL